MEYKLISFTFPAGANKRPIGGGLQTGYTFENPAVDKELNYYAADGWRPTSISNSTSGTLFILLERGDTITKY